MALVLLLLAGMWLGAGLYYFRGRPEARSADSIGSFRHQLRVLERTGPTTIDPAHSMRSAGSGAGFGLPSRIPTPGLGRPLALAPKAAVQRRRQTQKRRRDVFFGLCLGVFGALFLGLVPGLKVMWLLAAVLLVVLGVYAAVLVQLRNEAAERSLKVRFLHEEASVPEPAFLLQRSAN